MNSDNDFQHLSGDTDIVYEVVNLISSLVLFFTIKPVFWQKCTGVSAEPHKYPTPCRVLVSSALTGLDFPLPALTNSMLRTVRSGEGGSTHQGVVPNSAKRR